MEFMMLPLRFLGRKLIIALALITFAPRMLYVLFRYYIFRPILGQDNALLDITDLMRGWRVA